MIIIPAIDIKNGKCVRLKQGLADQETVYAENPVEVAKQWASMGAELIHVVDLDGAFTGETVNYNIYKEITSTIEVPIELGGGLRDAATVEKVLEAGVSKAILGTAAIKNPEMVKELCDKYGDRIIVGIDSKDGMVAIKGWVEKSSLDAITLAKDMSALGVKTFICTDISRDGMMIGPNLDYLKKIAESVDADIIASGGVSTIDDVKNINELEGAGITGMIIGKALYDKRIDFKEALEITNK